ncbi:nuclear pore complex protein Nup58 isoform X2 [Aphidius gifuensis]|uniref:nuclear pore complex protein Nup58 isoform X2 n=1 Tax=Aphidius gifuensis TaxID=684658 RepID=UPI001CDBD1D4|nr:nuclear pore complex protein Nup58 isoform X2 [Aphidius gifuensis]
MANFSFGTPSTTTANSSFGAFGAKPAAPAFGTPSFSTPAPAAGGGLTFGTPTATPATSAPTINFNFGGTSTPAAANAGLLTNPATSTGQTTNFFGTPAPAAAAPTTNLFGTPASAAPLTGSLGFGASTTTPASTGGLTFGAAPTGGLNFGGPTTSAPSFGAAPVGGLFGAKTTISTAPITTTINTNKGLGGLDVSINNKGLSHGSSSPTVAKENQIPNELIQNIDRFKEFVKTQKGLSSDIARGSARPLNRCAEDTASLMEMLTTLAGSVQRDRSLADKLKQDTAKALQNAEIAQRTHDTPSGLQYENTAPLLFFMELAESFEQDLMLFRSQIETTEKHIQSMMVPRALTPQELTMAMSKIYESLVAVAGRLQTVHAKVQQQKEQYLNLRKYVLKDSTNVFDDTSRIVGKNSQSNIGRVTSGPTPFGPGSTSFLSSTTINSGRQPGYSTQNSLGLAWI